MIQGCDFTLNHYKDVLEYAKKQYTFHTFSELPNLQKSENIILLRHDIDYSIETATVMAELESKLKIKSTYFVLLRGSFYNPYSPENTHNLKKILDLGHEIGLHYDSTELAKFDNPQEELKKEIKQLEQIIDNDVHIVTQHNPTVSPKLDKIPEQFLDARESEIYKSIPYISDSVKNWRSGCMCNHIGNERNLQILVHPIWWTKEKMSRNEILDDIVSYWEIQIKKAKDMHAKYLEDLGNTK